MSKRKKYNCLVEYVDNTQKKELKSRIAKNDNLEPWLLTFIERFSMLANDLGLSKKAISDKCIAPDLQKPHLKGEREILPQPTLSSITNPDSDLVRLPNVNHLIVLSKLFNVSIDYLVGLSDSKNPELKPLLDSLGLSESSIITLMLLNRLHEISQYSVFPNSGLSIDSDGGLDAEELPQLDSNGFYAKYYIDGKTVSKKAYKEKMSSITKAFPQFFRDCSSSITKKTRARFDELLPDSHFFSTLDYMLSYNNGLLINLLSMYLFSDITLDDDESSDAVLLSKINSCLVRMHDSLKKG